MLKGLLKEAVVKVAGNFAEDISDLLYSNKPVNEFIIAKKLDLTINQTRNILYKIANYSLVSSIRKKDKKKGWYTYFWKINVLKSLEFLKDVLLKQIELITAQINSRESKQFYVCNRCGIELTEENALTKNFTCYECGDLFVLKNNVKILRDLNRNLNKFKLKLSLVNEELKKEQVKVEKKELLKIKKANKEKADKRKAAAKKRLEAKKKAAKKKITKKIVPKRKKASKKVIKKKTTKKVKKSIISKRKVKKPITKKTVKKKTTKKKKASKKKVVKKKATKKASKKKK